MTPSQLTYGRSPNFILSPEPVSALPSGKGKGKARAAKSPEIEERAPQTKDGSCHQETETHAASCGPVNFPWSGQSDELSSIAPSQSGNGDHGPGKRKTGHGGEDYSGNRRPKHLANMEMNGWMSGVLM
ncbi:hypothetical protein N7530_002852 [Penicillium desertorum]|uniref:Uncharacterized protein n=1 Tax=Penicillium desertorum TaxID=1303715 RepID=A0A9W9X4H9_9EURO|nr:hypothetical protein N7530_002852 [Penicillium desertorum]